MLMLIVEVAKNCSARVIDSPAGVTVKCCSGGRLLLLLNECGGDTGV